MKNILEFADKPSTVEVAERSEDLLRGLANAYKNTNAKVILNWGKTFSPVIEDFGDLLDDAYVNSTCDQDCAVQCFREDKFFDGKFPFRPECLRKCGCEFEIDKKIN